MNVIIYNNKTDNIQLQNVSKFHGAVNEFDDDVRFHQYLCSAYAMKGTLLVHLF